MLEISERRMGLHSLTFLMNIIAHYFMVIWETESWVSERIICRYFGEV